MPQSQSLRPQILIQSNQAQKLLDTDFSKIAFEIELSADGNSGHIDLFIVDARCSCLGCKLESNSEVIKIDNRFIFTAKGRLAEMGSSFYLMF